jgi:hypothetical protein
MDASLPVCCGVETQPSLNTTGYSATLRIFGDLPDLKSISRKLGVDPTHTHHKGEPYRQMSRFAHDMWSYTTPVRHTEPLHKHLDALWTVLKPHRHYLHRLKRTATVDIFLGCRSDSARFGIELPHSSLAIFQELGISFELSIVVT